MKEDEVDLKNDYEFALMFFFCLQSGYICQCTYLYFSVLNHVNILFPHSNPSIMPISIQMYHRGKHRIINGYMAYIASLVCVQYSEMYSCICRLILCQLEISLNNLKEENLK